MTDAEAIEIMSRFAKAFFSRSATDLALAVTEDVEWHFAIGNDAPDGRVHRGVSGILEGIAANDAAFETLRFTDVVFRAMTPGQILMTCLVQGKRRGGDGFQVRGIELITVRDGRVAKKDVFWKQPL